MSRRYPKYESVGVVCAQMAGLAFASYAMFRSAPRMWGIPGRLFLASGPVVLMVWSVDVLLDVLEAQKKDGPAKQD